MNLFNHVGGLTPVEMVAEMVDGKRVYNTPSGHRYPSITTVISNNAKKQAGLARWRARVGKEKAANISARSSGRGTKYHLIAEDYFNNDLDLKKYKEHPLPVLMFHHSRSVLDRINNIYLQEAALYSDHLEVAGRVDCIAEYEGELAVIDFKTSKKIKPEEWIENYFVQEVAYACMYYEMTGIPVKKLITLMVTPGGDVKVFDKRDKDVYIKLLVRYIKEFVQNNTQLPTNVK